MEFRTPATDEDNVFSYYFPKTILSVAKYECLIPSGSDSVFLNSTEYDA